MATAEPKKPSPGGFKPRFRLGMLGTPAPVFPGFEIDISDRVEDHDKPDAVWHRERAKRMLQRHPELKELIGNTPSTAVWCVLFAGAQIGLAATAANVSVWAVAILAYVVGAWININLFMLSHECNHCLVFKKNTPNRWLFTITSLPMFLSGHHTWWVEHRVHHSDLGAKKDFISRRRSFFLVTRILSPLVFPYSLMMIITQIMRSAVGLLVYGATLLAGRTLPDRRALAILADDHLVSGYRKNDIRGWAVTYPLLWLSMAAALGLLCGWKALLYLLLSQAFMTGFLHPLMFGMILSNSHFHGHRCYQPTSSYYGWLNWITFHFGLHTEHHDLAGIPWSRLPRIRKIAPESYNELAETRSYVGLTFRFLFGSRQDFESTFDNQERLNSGSLPPQTINDR